MCSSTQSATAHLQHNAIRQRQALRIAEARIVAISQVDSVQIVCHNSSSSFVRGNFKKHLETRPQLPSVVDRIEQRGARRGAGVISILPTNGGNDQLRHKLAMPGNIARLLPSLPPFPPEQSSLGNYLVSHNQQTRKFVAPERIILIRQSC